MGNNHYGMTVPLGLGASVEIVVECSSATATVAVVDDHYGTAVPDDTLLAIGEAVLATWFLTPSDEPTVLGVRHFCVVQGWTQAGWRSSFEARLAKTFTAFAPEVADVSV